MGKRRHSRRKPELASSSAGAVVVAVAVELLGSLANRNFRYNCVRVRKSEALASTLYKRSLLTDMNLFGRKSAAPVKATPQATADTIRKIREQLETLEKRELHIEKKIGLQLEEAKKKSASKDKRGAIFALKRKKMFEAEIEKLQGARMTLETQVMTLESAHVNMETFQALRSGANQMKAIHGQMNVDTVDNIMDDIQEEMATADEIGRAISQPLGSALYDDDELEEELRMMEELGLEEEALKEPAYAQPPPAVAAAAAPAPVPVPARVPVPAAAAAPQYELPEVPTHRVESNINVVGPADEDELEALRKLEASMAL